MPRLPPFAPVCLVRRLGGRHLRLISHLTPDKFPIGSAVTRKRVDADWTKNTPRKLGRLPTDLPNPLALVSMAIQSAGPNPSVLLVSDGLGIKRRHGRVAMLETVHTVSAGGLVAASAA